MEPPECPVCLQAYDGADAVPRVLPCGHSACESCLAALPPRSALPDTVRCPACNQVVRLPRPPGPAALPKNIDLLRLCDSNQSSPKPKPKNNPKPTPSPSPEFIPSPWTQHLFDTWNDLIIPPDALSVSNGALTAITKTITIDSPPLGRLWCFCENQPVSLLPVGGAASLIESGWFRPSHTARVMEALDRLGAAARAELGFVVEASSRQHRGLCKVYGLWMNPDVESSPLFLVFERFDRVMSGLFDLEEKWSLELDATKMFSFGVVGMELCEAVMGLHSQGIVCGCLSPDSFCFDEFGHCLLDLNNVLLAARRIREDIRAATSGRGRDDSDRPKTQALVSPEVFILLSNGVCAASNCGFEGSVGYGSDVWSLACILAMLLLLGDALLAVELFEGFCRTISEGFSEHFAESSLTEYEIWREKVVSRLKALLLGTQFDSLLRILTSCLDYHIKCRPQVHDVWRCIRSLFVKSRVDDMAASEFLIEKENSLCCLILGNLCSQCEEAANVSPREGSGSASGNTSDVDLVGSSGSSVDRSPEKVDGDIIKGLRGGRFKSVTLRGHQDCVTRLTVGGGFLFSSSFDKTIHVWSLQDFSLVQSLRGHDHRIMAMVVVDASLPLCISGDSGSGIFVWEIGTSIGVEPLKKWYAHNDWRYSGIYSLASSGTGYLYSGSGDKSIKAWSLKDYSLSCTMSGHRSTVSSLAVADGILYSGSWDGTIRLWCLNDHSPLSILGDDTPGSLPPVLALSVDGNILVSSYENGCLKMWRNDALVRSMQIQKGAIFALHLDARWLFTGGWDKVIDIQELSQNELQVDIRPVSCITCDSVITSLLYWQGKLFAGFSNKELKVYYCGS